MRGSRRSIRFGWLRLDIPQTKSDLAATDEAILLDKHALAALIGQGPDRALRIDRPALALRAQGIPANASIDLIGRRPDIAASRTRVEAAAERIKEARAAFFPNINIAALAGFQSLGLGSFLSSGSQFASVTPAISLPLFHGGALQGQYRGRRGQYDEAVANYDGEVIEALRETADTVTSERQLAERLVQSRNALADYEDALRVARGRYEEGLTDLSERPHRTGKCRQRAPLGGSARNPCLHPRRAADPRPRRRNRCCLTLCSFGESHNG